MSSSIIRRKKNKREREIRSEETIRSEPIQDNENQPGKKRKITSEDTPVYIDLTELDDNQNNIEYRSNNVDLTKMGNIHEPSEKDAPDYIDLTEFENNIKHKPNNVDLTKMGNIHEPREEGAPDYIDLTELDDNPIIQNSIKHKVFQLVKKLDAEKHEIILKIIELKENDKLKMIERIMKMNEVEKFKIIKREEAEKRAIIEKKEADNQKTQWEVKECHQSILRLENTCSIRGALEFIRSKILFNNSPPIFEEPVDKTLLRLSQDKNFINYLQKACYENHLRFDDVKRCICGLYHTSSKNFHGHNGKITINAQSWSTNEVLSLGVIFEYFKIQWSYCDADGVLKTFPYKISPP